jgi:energy-coupling factor transporter ATP-binding protein EcfA2
MRHLFARITSDTGVTDDFISDLANKLIAGSLEELEEPLTVAALPTGSDLEQTVTLQSIGSLKNVNALIGDQELVFGDTGITLIFGDNGSGKSGYARLVKAIARSRHSERVLPNAFEPDSDSLPQSASITYRFGSEMREGTWPEIADSSTRAIHFYDEACGDTYVQTDSEVTYRPAVLAVLDSLVDATDMLRSHLDRVLSNSRSEPLPNLDASTDTGAFLLGLSRSTKESEIDTICTVAENIDQEIGRLAGELARLQATDPGKEKSRLEQSSAQLSALADHLESLAEILNDKQVEAAKENRRQAKCFREAAKVASSTSFAGEPLTGVGTETWNVLWSAAEAFALAHAYPGRDFPATGKNDHCVLCQQPLSSSARERLHRFHSFVTDTTEQQAQDAERKLASVIANLQFLEVTRPAITQAGVVLRSIDEDLATQVDDLLVAYAKRRDSLLKFLTSGAEFSNSDIVAVDPVKVHALASSTLSAATKIDDAQFRRHLQVLDRDHRELAAKKTLSSYREALKAEVSRLGETHKVTSLRDSVNTTTITIKASALTRDYVTEIMGNHFIRETERLGLDRVELDDRGASKGRLRHRPALVGVNTGNSPDEVLSEGEQTALGLAGFFTELHFDTSKSAVVFDDPVSSLSHARRKDVAKRIVEFASDRQVIVFTHDLTFLGFLLKRADLQGVPVAPRSIERTGERTPGKISDVHPWKAKDVPKRFDYLQRELTRVGRERKDWDQAQYEREVAEWAGQLSETYEQIISNYIANEIFDAATGEVRPKKFRFLVGIAADDNTTLQAEYSEISEWARRHNKSTENNFVAPEPSKLSDALENARQWFSRIKSYQK